MPVPDIVRDDRSGIQNNMKQLDSADASLRARLPDRVRHKLRRIDVSKEFQAFSEIIKVASQPFNRGIGYIKERRAKYGNKSRQN